MAIKESKDVNTRVVRALVPNSMEQEFTEIAERRKVSKSSVIRKAICEFNKKWRL